MNATQTLAVSNENEAVTPQWVYVVQMAASAICALNQFASAILLLFYPLLLKAAFSGEMMTAILDASPQFAELFSGELLFLLALVSAVQGIVFLITAIYALFPVIKRPLPVWMDTSRPIWRKIIMFSIFLLVPALLITWVLTTQPQQGIVSYLLPLISVLSGVLPTIWLLNAGIWQLNGGSQQRKWALFSFSLAVVPMLAMMIQLTIVLAASIWFFAWMMSQINDAQFMREIEQLATRMQLSGNDPDRILAVFRPYLLRPTVVFWIFAAISGIVPIIEEMLKPLAVWLLYWRKPTPAQGFVAGMICGAAFGFYEALGNLPNAAMSDTLIILPVARLGASLMHIFATGLMGWGLAATWRDAKYLRVVVTYIIAMLLHGLWNALAVGGTILPIMLGQTDLADWQQALFMAPLVFLGIIIFIGMVMFSRHLQRSEGGQALLPLPPASPDQPAA